MVKKLWRSILQAMTMPPAQVDEVQERIRKVRRETCPHGFRITRNRNIVLTTRVYCCREMPIQWQLDHQKN